MTTFPFIYAHLSGGAPSGSRRAYGGRRGFTLIELMAVVLIITLVSTIAIPGVVKRMKSNRTRQAAENIAMTFRQARIRATGRSAAVLVRYDQLAGTVEVKEAIEGTTSKPSGCERRPESSCLNPVTRWDNNDRSQRIELTDYLSSGDFTLGASDYLGSAVQTLDFCFAPSGKAYVRTTLGSGASLLPWTSPYRIDVERSDGVGFRRSVLIAPSGSATVVASPK